MEVDAGTSNDVVATKASTEMEALSDAETSNDVVATKASTEMEALADKPLMILFKRLINNENKQNTVLSNSQIMNILEKEFNINTQQSHELEMEIYLSIMKKFLKDWPQWDDFDSAINMLKQKNDNAVTEKMLLRKYKQLKSYMLSILDIAMQTAKSKVLEVEEKFTKLQEEMQQKDQPEEDLSDLILEIQCTRPQLNNLILKHPHPQQNYTIFNTIDSGPSKISLETLSYEAMLNWWDVEICFKMQSVHFVRSTAHGVKHTLMNNKLNIRNKIPKLKSGYQEKPTTPGKPSDMSTLKKQSFAEELRKIFLLTKDVKLLHFLKVILSIIEKDLAGLPNDLQECTSYRKYFSKHPYIRDLCTDTPEAKNDKEAMNYDLFLRETISPMYQLDIFKVEPLLKTYITSVDFQNVYVKCKTCSYKLMGYNMLEQLRLHILDHLQEPDWQCMKCKESFTMITLANNRWFHKCPLVKNLRDEVDSHIVRL